MKITRAKFEQWLINELVKVREQRDLLLEASLNGDLESIRTLGLEIKQKSGTLNNDVETFRDLRASNSESESGGKES